MRRSLNGGYWQNSGDRLIHVRRTGNLPSMQKRRTFNDPGHAHELTFSTYRRTRIFEEDAFCRLFLAKLDASRKAHAYEVWAYVVMPDHVHLLVWPTLEKYDVVQFRKSLKGAVAREAVHLLRQRDDAILGRLSLSAAGVPQRTRLWQTGGGYDRNIHSTAACQKSIAYIHNNPVVAGLCPHPCDYEWSSACWYRGDKCDFQVDRAKN
ncbi:MAG: transposase [Chthonomonadaceae bacterium]|nr:transposase [Chthonomonadaceae bacterium]